MKAILIGFFFTFFTPFQSDFITETDLIGKWRIVRVKSIVCMPKIELTVEFTDENLVMMSIDDKLESTKSTEKISWSIREKELILSNNQTKEVGICKYTYNGNTLILQIPNSSELTLKKK